MNKRMKPRSTYSTIKRLFQYMNKYRVYLIIAIIIIGLASLGSIFGNYMIKPIINSLVAGEGVKTLAKQVLLTGVVYLLSVISHYISARLFVYCAENTTANIRHDLFSHIQTLPVSYFDSREHGDLMSAMTNDVDNVAVALAQSLSNIVRESLMFFGTIVMMFILSPMLSAINVILLGLLYFAVKIVAGRSSRAFRSRQATLADLNGFIEEYMSGQKVIKVFNREKETIEDFSEHNEKLFEDSTIADTYATLMFPLTGNLTYVVFSIIAMIGSYMTINGIFAMDIGTLASYLNFTRNVSRPVTNIANQFNMIVAALAGAERIFDILDEEPEIDKGQVKLVTDRKGQCYWHVPTALYDCRAIIKRTEQMRRTDLPDPEFAGRYPGCLVPLRGDLRFVNVSFGYEKSHDPVLKDVSFYAKPGQRLAFVGTTGAGKTTIINLINRFYEIDNGHIYFDGIDIRDINKQDLRHQLGTVLQDVHLFEDTIRENIRYGRLDATDEEIVAAAKAANAHDLIMQLNDGYDTMLTTDGLNLSQGQRQLISIARAAVNDPPILILDEATSSVDTRTESLIGQGMDEIMQERTVFAIAHRLSTVRHSNAILVLENGLIIERGEHHELMELKGRYYEFNTGVIELE
ncbi:MAG: ABC transporter ATP-binding protein [Saccharofermentanales bacterium]